MKRERARGVEGCACLAVTVAAGWRAGERETKRAERAEREGRAQTDRGVEPGARALACVIEAFGKLRGFDRYLLPSFLPNHPHQPNHHQTSTYLPTCSLTPLHFPPTLNPTSLTLHPTPSNPFLHTHLSTPPPLPPPYTSFPSLVVPPKNPP